jgi:hypothetical protein
MSVISKEGDITKIKFQDLGDQVQEFIFIKRVDPVLLDAELKAFPFLDNVEIDNTLVKVRMVPTSNEAMQKVRAVILKHKPLPADEVLLQGKAEDYRIFGNSLADQLIDRFGARNFKYNVPSTSINQLLTVFSPLENALRKGALATTRLGLMAIKGNFPAYTDILEWGLTQLNVKLGLK